MAIVQSQTTQPGSVTNTAIGSYLTDATAAAIVITTGFSPRYVRVCNETSGDLYEWFYGMASAEALKQVAAGTRSIITTLGITSSATGFTIGLDLDVNVINEQLSWMAIG